ncbi:MAG: 4-hydroxy-tetrahydrodipicolinate reductase [Myxococcota bacterium]
MVRVVVSGAGGRLGSRILSRLVEAEGVEVTGALVRPGSRHEQRVLAEGVTGTSSLDLLGDRPVLIEAALVPAALEHVARAADFGAPVCVATTGFDAAQRRVMDAYAAQIPLLIAPNLSLGVNVLIDLAARAARALDGYHLEVLEMHHARKRDAPSGTAWALAQAAEEARGRDLDRDAILARAGETGPRGEHEVGLQTLRGGDVIGEHTVFLVGESERVELTHRAATRDAFASGAVAAARFLGDPALGPGLYTMRDVLRL